MSKNKTRFTNSATGNGIVTLHEHKEQRFASVEKIGRFLTEMAKSDLVPDKKISDHLSLRVIERAKLFAEMNIYEDAIEQDTPIPNNEEIEQRSSTEWPLYMADMINDLGEEPLYGALNKTTDALLKRNGIYDTDDTLTNLVIVEAEMFSFIVKNTELKNENFPEAMLERIIEKTMDDDNYENKVKGRPFDEWFNEALGDVKTEITPSSTDLTQ